MPVLISQNSRKGGTGKTTATIWISTALTLLGHRVLIIDADPSGNATLALNPKSELTLNLATGLRQNLPLDALTESTIHPNLWLIRSHPDLDNIANEKSGAPDRAYLFSHLLNTPAINNFDYIFFDNAPDQSPLLEATMKEIDWFLLPMEAGTFARNGIKSMLQYSAQMKHLNPDLKLGGVFISKYKKSAPSELLMIESIKVLCERANLPYLEPAIPHSDQIESAYQGKTSIFKGQVGDSLKTLRSLNRRSPAALGYLSIANTIKMKFTGRIRTVQPVNNSFTNAANIFDAGDF